MITLFIRESADSWLRDPCRFETYEQAVKHAQRTVGPRNFYVETHNRVPSREEQLLITQPKKKSKRQEILEDL